MYSNTARAYDDQFVQTTVDFGNEMAKLRAYRDELSSKYSALQLRKMELLLSNSSTKVIEAEMEEVARVKATIAGEIDSLMAVQNDYLKSCMHARA